MILHAPQIALRAFFGQKPVFKLCTKGLLSSQLGSNLVHTFLGNEVIHN